MRSGDETPVYRAIDLPSVRLIHTERNRTLISSRLLGAEGL